MKYCDKCKLSVRGNETICPLCQSRLSGADEEELYPVVPTIYKQFELYFKLLIFVTIAAGIICIAINLILPESGFWSAYVLFGLFSFWIIVAYAVRKKDNLPKTITGQALLISVFSILWDLLTGWNGWSLNYVFPISCIIAMLALAVTSRVMKMPAGDYIVYLTVDIAFGIIPYILYLTGNVHIVIPSLICIAMSILTISSLVLFEGKNILQEIERHFNV